jgi:hypothetical protein
MRAEREIELDDSWANSDPTERWWGCEVVFPPELDEVFGVTINKQAATLWSQIAHSNWTALAEGNEKLTDVIERLKDEGDHRGILLEVADFIRKQLGKIRSALEDQTKGRRPASKRHEGPTIEDQVTAKIRQRAEEKSTKEDLETFGKGEAETLEKDLVDTKRYSQEAAKQIVEAVWKRQLRLVFLVADLDGKAFFRVEQKPGGIAEVIFNKLHPFYRRLYGALSIEDLDAGPAMGLEERLEKSVQALQLMFAAWARYEQESTERERSKLDDIRQDWGRMANFFLQENEDEE